APQTSNSCTSTRPATRRLTRSGRQNPKGTAPSTTPLPGLVLAQMLIRRNSPTHRPSKDQTPSRLPKPGYRGNHSGAGPCPNDGCSSNDGCNMDGYHCMGDAWHHGNTVPRQYSNTAPRQYSNTAPRQYSNTAPRLHG